MAAEAGWRAAVDENREELERIAEHGKTDLADHVREILDEYDAEEVGEDVSS